MSLNTVLHEYKIFSQGGLLLKHIKFNQIVNSHGSPISVSNNGQVYLFKIPKELKFTVFVMTIKGFIKIKEINIEKSVKNSGLNSHSINIKACISDKMDVVISYRK